MTKFIVNWRYGATVENLVFQHGGDGFKSSHLQPI
jgi:hypothetical protein